MTDIATEPTITATDTLEVDGPSFARAIGNAALFAESGRGALPALTAVRLEYDGTRLEAIATDRYQLAVDTSCRILDDQTAAAPPAWHFSLPVDDIKRIIGHVTANMPKGVTSWPVRLTVADGRLEVRAFDGSLTIRTADGEFPPRWRSLFPDCDPIPTVELGLNPVFLAKYAKVTPDHGKRGSQVARFAFYGPNKPAVVTIGETFRCLHMPVRLP